MTEETKNQDQDQPKASDAWSEVGRQVQTLGETLAAAFKATIQDEQVQQHLDRVQSDLNAAGEQISQKAKEASDSMKNMNVDEETRKIGEEVQATGRDLADEIQPHLINALKKIQTGIDQIVDNLGSEAAQPTADAEDAAPNDTTSTADKEAG